MKYTLLDEAAKVVPNPDILVNLVSKRVKQLRNGAEPLVQSLEKLSLEDIALREVIEGKITADI
ncbi:MAG: DNA-directed RNA polymerase subunit omega [bacterium]